MADNTLSNILFSADFDPKQYIEGIDQMINSVKKLGEQEVTLKKQLSETESQLKDNEEAQKKLQKSIDDSATKKAADSTAKLTSELKALKEQNAGLTQTLSSQKNALDAVVQKNTELGGSYERVRKVVAELQKQSGSPVKLQINEADVLNALQDIRLQFKSFSEGIDWSNVTDELKAQILTAKTDIEALTTFIDAANAKLANTNPASEGYVELSQAVGTANEMLASYNVLIEETGREQNQTAKSTVSLRSRIKELRDELTKLEDAGLENTETFRQTQLEAARLTDQYGDMQQRIRILSSDTKNLDFGVAALQTAATGYQTLLGAQELFGISNDATAEAQRKLFAIMNLVQGAQQLQNLLLKEGVLRTVGADIATKAYAATQRILTVSLGASATAARTLSTVLLATGVGALVIGLGFLISKLSDLSSANEDAAETTKKLAEEQRKLKEAIDDTFENSNTELKRRRDKIANEERIKDLELQSGKQKEINNLKRKNIDLDIESIKSKAAGKFGLLTDKEQLEVNEKIFRLEKERARVGIERKKEVTGSKTDNVYQKELARLNEELAKASSKEFTSDDTIRASFTASLEKQFLAINDYLKKKQLTKPQGENLKKLIRQIIDIDQKKALDEFHKKIEEVKTGIEKELQDFRFDESERRIANVHDEISRETQTIIQETKKQRAELREKRKAAFDDLNQDLANGFINKTQFDSYAAELTDLYDKLLEDIKTGAAIKNAELAERIFNASLDEIETTLKNTGIAIVEGNNGIITQLSQQFLKGEISYSSYQKRLTKILKDEAKARKEAELKSIDEEIAAIDKRLVSQSLSPTAQKSETERLRGLRERRAALNREIEGGDVDAKNDKTNKRIEGIVKYVTAIGGFLDQVIGFWQKANEVEQRSIERSIALQDKRVEAATRVAERGNATYLKLEEEKQQELLIKQEAAARRQMAINAALQASQLLVAVTGAVAKIATPGVGAVDVIASIGVIIGALASGYALVKSLQDNQPKFFEGTDYVRRDFTKNTAKVQRKNEPAGRDTIPAWLHEGESVNDVKTTEKYHPTIKAIHDGLIPPEVINGVVNMYPKWNMPALNTKRMDQAIQVNVMHDSKVAGLLSDNLKEMKRLRKEISAKQTNISLDSKGLAVSMAGHMEQINLNKKS